MIRPEPDAEERPVRGLQRTPDIAGDHLNAARFIREHGSDSRFSPELGRWYLWDGSWFVEDRLNRIRDLAADTIDRLRVWAAEAETADEFKRRSAHYQRSATSSRSGALLEVVGADPEIAVAVSQLDSHPQQLACLNGTIDLRTGELSEPNRALLLTRGVSVNYEPAAHSDEWSDFLFDILGGDPELVAYVQRLLGYCLTGVVAEHVLPVLFGQGANGKSTLIGVVQDLLGDLAMTAPEGLVIRHDHEPHPERIAALRGMRLVVSAELEARAVLAEQTVKMLTGGDTLTARELYGRRFNFAPSHKVLLVTNHRPKVRGTDHAIWRRIRLVPFDVIIPPERQDPSLRRRLVADHAPAVLAWLVQGAVEWHRSGLGDAGAVTAATDGYRHSEDVMGAFLDEMTIQTPARTKVGELYAVWRGWCERTGERVGRKQDFTAALEDRAVDLERYGNNVYALELGIRSDFEDS